MSFSGEGGGPGGQPGLDSPTTSHQNRMSATVAQNVCQAPAMLISIADGQAVGGAWCSGLRTSPMLRRRNPAQEVRRAPVALQRPTTHLPPLLTAMPAAFALASCIQSWLVELERFARVYRKPLVWFLP